MLCPVGTLVGAMDATQLVICEKIGCWASRGIVRAEYVQTRRESANRSAVSKNVSDRYSLTSAEIQATETCTKCSKCGHEIKTSTTRFRASISVVQEFRDFHICAEFGIGGREREYESEFFLGWQKMLDREHHVFPGGGGDIRSRRRGRGSELLGYVSGRRLVQGPPRAVGWMRRRAARDQAAELCRR